MLHSSRLSILRHFRRTFHQSVRFREATVREHPKHVRRVTQERSVVSFSNKRPREAVNALDAVRDVQSDQTVFVHTAAAAPLPLIDAIVSRHDELRNVRFTHLHTEGPAHYIEEQYAQSFSADVFFVGGNMREAVRKGRASYIPAFLSEIERLFINGRVPLDVALLQVSPPDAHGYCSLGVSVDISETALQAANLVIAQVNSRMPRTHGAGLVHESALDVIYHHNAELPTPKKSTITDVQSRIGENVASLIPDGATLQMGIGAIPDAVLSNLHSHKDLGIHTEMFSDGVLDLLEKGVITNSGSWFKNHIVSTFLVGSHRLYDFVDDNPLVMMLRAQDTNSVRNIRRNRRMCAINSAIEVDLTGQVCADSIGSSIYSGVGGQVDFLRGAALSDDQEGRPIIALPSTTSKGRSRIVTRLSDGAGVTTTRAHVHYVVTEHGIANLYGRDLTQRADALLSVAAPEHRDELANAL